jgi:hypothetical protein
VRGQAAILPGVTVHRTPNIILALVLLGAALPATAQDQAAVPAPPAEVAPAEAAAPGDRAAPAAAAATPTVEHPLPARHALAPPLHHAWPIPVEHREVPANWWLPPLEVVGFTLTLHTFNRKFNSDPVYDVTWDDIQRHFQEPWAWDGDKFATNQFAHPYEGSMYFNAARSLGHGFWVSGAAAFLGSWTWEMFAEKEQPSINDQITTTVAGSFLGEILYRLSNRILDSGGAKPGIWRELGAAAVSPMSGLNRAFYGDTYRPYGYTSHPSYGRLQVGAHTAADLGADGSGDASRIRGISFGGELYYGLPVGDWVPDEPFDYFDLTADLTIDSKSNTREASGNFSIHGLLAGAAYGEARTRRFVGLFGTYDYLTPEAYRASSAAFGPGITGQRQFGDHFAFQGTAILSLGFGAGGSSAVVSGSRDYHFGLQAVGFASAQLYFEDRLRARLTTRQYFTSGKVSPEPDSWERSNYSQLALLWRFIGPHALGVEWTGARRTAYYPETPDISSRSNQLEFFYAILSDHGMGLGRLVE